MTKRMKLKGRWVLVTGASSGLGYAMSHVLARDYGANLILVARRRERLADLADALRSQYGVEVVLRPCDLTRRDEVQGLLEQCTSSHALQAAILNAGVTYYGRQLESPDGASHDVLGTNVTSVVSMTQHLVRYFVDQNNGGGLMLVSSLAGFLPIPYQALYSASKAFLATFGLALRAEIRGTGVSLTVFAPGGIATEMLETSGLARRFGTSGPGLMRVDRCARFGVAALVRRKTLSIPGPLNKVTYLAMRLAPRSLANRLAGRIYRV